TNLAHPCRPPRSWGCAVPHVRLRSADARRVGRDHRHSASSPYPVTVLPPDPSRSERCLATLGVTTRSWLGAVIAHSGGLLVDHGWLRVLGSGSGDLPDALYDTDPAGGGLVVALDVLGGQFVWAPSEPGKPPTLHYFGP